MKLQMESQYDYVKEVNLSCTPTEWLVINKALRLLSENSDVDEIDKGIAVDMFNTEPLINEVEVQNEDDRKGDKLQDNMLRV